MFQVEYFFVKCIHTLHLLIHEVTWSCSGQNSFSLNHRLWGLLEVLKCLPWWWRRSRRTQKLFVLELSAKSDAYICLWKEAWSNRWIYVWNVSRTIWGTEWRKNTPHSSQLNFTADFLNKISFSTQLSGLDEATWWRPGFIESFHVFEFSAEWWETWAAVSLTPFLSFVSLKTEPWYWAFLSIINTINELLIILFIS